MTGFTNDKTKCFATEDGKHITNRSLLGQISCYNCGLVVEPALRVRPYAVIANSLILISVIMALVLTVVLSFREETTSLSYVPLVLCIVGLVCVLIDRKQP